MVSTAKKAAGATIGKGDGASPEVFTTVVNITNIQGLGITADDINVTDLSSVYQEFLQAIKELMPISISGFFDQENTQHQEMRDAVGNNTAVNYKISNSAGQSVVVPCYVQSFAPPEYATDGAITLSFTLRPTGAAPAWTDA